MTIETNLNIIFETLKNYGIDRKFIQEVLLPEWWNAEISNTKAGFLQTISIIAKNLGINTEVLLGNTGEITLKYPLHVKFKTAKNISFPETHIWPRSLAIRISEIIEQIYSTKFDNIIDNPLKIRAEIILKYSNINLVNFLDYLWTKGIPVIYISEFPQNVYKMDGMVINFKGRLIILLSKSHKQDPWLLFILAHELGHIIKNHLFNSESIIYDSDIESIQDDKEEIEAHEVALKLLTGLDNPNLIKRKIQSGFQLVITARKMSRKLNIDPGTIILNYAYCNNDYPTAQQALKILNPKADAISMIKFKMKNYLNLDNLSEENSEYFSKITALLGK